jgi:hypothetical protein
MKKKCNSKWGDTSGYNTIASKSEIFMLLEIFFFPLRVSSGTLHLKFFPKKNDISL